MSWYKHNCQCFFYCLLHFADWYTHISINGENLKPPQNINWAEKIKIKDMHPLILMCKKCHFIWIEQKVCSWVISIIICFISWENVTRWKVRSWNMQKIKENTFCYFETQLVHDSQVKCHIKLPFPGAGSWKPHREVTNRESRREDRVSEKSLTEMYRCHFCSRVYCQERAKTDHRLCYIWNKIFVSTRAC